MTKRTSSSFGTTRCRVATANRWTLPSTLIPILLTALLGLSAGSCSTDKTLIVGSTAQDLGTLQVVAGNDQTGTVGAMLPTPITAKVQTQGGQGVAGISVQWTFSAGGGSLTSDGAVSDSLISTTDKSGATSVYWQLDTIAGDQVATATLFGTDQTTSSSSKQVKFHSHGKAGGPATIVVSPASDTLAVSDSVQFTATVLDRWKNVVSGAMVSWSSSNDSVATVSSSGMAKALKSGSAMVVATTSGASSTPGSTGPSSVSGQASVTVLASSTTTNPPGTVTDLRVSSVTDSSVTLAWTQVDDGTGNPANYALRYATPTLSWGSASATEVSVPGTSVGATARHTFAGLQAGTSYQFQLVSYRGTLNAGAVFGGFSSIVSGSTKGSGTLQTPTVTATPSSLSLTSIGATAQLSAVAKDSTGTTVTNPGFTWSSLASSIASVSNSGLVTAKAIGATAIIVTAACCGSDTVPVQVSTSGTYQTPTVTATPSSLSFTSIGATAQLSAVATDSTGNTVGNPGFTWTSLASSIASVSSTGLVTAQAAGTTGVIVSAACCGSDTVAVQVSTSGPAQTLLSEGFEDGNLASRGWFDATSVSIANDARPGSSGTHSLLWHWATGTTAPQGSSRFDFTPSNSVYVSYWIKFSSNWIGSGKTYHPHLFQILTTADNDYIGPSLTHLTCYDELLYLNGNLVANLAIQDALMIDESNLNVDLFGVTENHSVGGYNGQHEFDDSTSTVSWDLYLYSPGQHTNYKMIRPKGVTIADADKNQWHHIESYWQLNSIVNGKAQQDGVLQYWVDGVLRVDRHNVYYRTGANPTMQFRTFLLAPYIGDGSPVDQSIWVDDLLLATKKP